MSKIEWTEKTWNPITGCDHISPGCDNCYARRMTKRLKAMSETVGTSDKYANGFDVTCHHDVLFSKSGNSPIKRQKPTIYFVNSMSDTFHKDVPESFLRDLYFVMMDNKRHTFIVLTKRVERMAGFFSTENCFQRPNLSNIWHGVTICNQSEADEKIPHLLKVPGKRFLSIEPMLGPIDLSAFIGLAPSGAGGVQCYSEIDQVILGGESGPNARHVNPSWARSVRDRCDVVGVPFMFKQWGGWIHTTQLIEPEIAELSHRNVTHVKDETSGNVGEYFFSVGKKKAGRVFDGVIHDGLAWSAD